MKLMLSAIQRKYVYRNFGKLLENAKKKQQPDLVKRLQRIMDKFSDNSLITELRATDASIVAGIVLQQVKALRTLTIPTYEDRQRKQGHDDPTDYNEYIRQAHMTAAELDNLITLINRKLED